MKKLIVLAFIVVLISCGDNSSRTESPNNADSTSKIDNTRTNDNSGDTASYNRMPDKSLDTTAKKDTSGRY